MSPIPAVQNPRDVAAMARRTCELLTPQQAQEFGFDLPPTQREGLFGTVACEWHTITRDGRMPRWAALRVAIDNPTLEVRYNLDQGRPSFELTEVAGYPTLVSRSNADLPTCDIDAKPAELQSVSLAYRADEFSGNPHESCVVGKQIMAAVLMNLPPKS